MKRRTAAVMLAGFLAAQSAWASAAQLPAGEIGAVEAYALPEAETIEDAVETREPGSAQTAEDAAQGGEDVSREPGSAQAVEDAAESREPESAQGGEAVSRRPETESPETDVQAEEEILVGGSASANAGSALQEAAMDDIGVVPDTEQGTESEQLPEHKPSGDASAIVVDAAHFPDKNFRACVSRNCDKDRNGELSQAEIAATTELDCSFQEISDLTGIAYFKKLKSLSCVDNHIRTLDVSANTELQTLYCFTNELTSLNISKNAKLAYLNCGDNRLTSLDVSASPLLLELDCYDNQLTALNVQKNTGLKVLTCYGNRLKTLDISKNTALKTLNCAYNELTSLDISGMDARVPATGGAADPNDPNGLKELQYVYVYCQNNQIENLKLGTNAQMLELHCHNNRLAALNIDRAALPNLNTLYCDDQARTAALRKTETGWKVDMADLVGYANTSRVQITEMPKGATLSGTALLFDESAVSAQMQYTYNTGSADGAQMHVVLQIQRCTDHVYQNVRTVDSTCTAEGTVYKECTICGASATEALPKKAHTYKEQIIVQPTCTSMGSSCEKCTVCGGIKAGSQKSIAKMEHTYGAYKTVRAATVFQEGSQQRACSVCGAVQTASLKKLTPTVAYTTTSLPLQVGRTVSLKSYVRMQSGDYTTRWKSFDERVATVDQNGNVTAKKAGRVYIAVATRAGAAAKNLLLTVQDAAVRTTAISGLHTGMKLELGKSEVLKPVITPATSQDKVTYVSGNANIVAVSQNGTIKAMHAGTANVYVRSGTKYHRITVQVTVPSLTAISNVRATGGMSVGSTYQLKPMRVPTNSAGVFYYKSSDSSIASVSASGLVTAKKKGIVTITVTARNVSTSMRLTVH